MHKGKSTTPITTDSDRLKRTTDKRSKEGSRGRGEKNYLNFKTTRIWSQTFRQGMADVFCQCVRNTVPYKESGKRRCPARKKPAAPSSFSTFLKDSIIPGYFNGSSFVARHIGINIFSLPKVD
jgi:hypothetical protein